MHHSPSDTAPHLQQDRCEHLKRRHITNQIHSYPLQPDRTFPFDAVQRCNSDNFSK